MLISHLFNFLYLYEDHKSRVFSNWVGQYLVSATVQVCHSACLPNGDGLHYYPKGEPVKAVKKVVDEFSYIQYVQHEMLSDILFPCKVLLWCFLLAGKGVYIYYVYVLVGRNGQKNNQQLIYYNSPIWKESWSSWQQGKGEQESPRWFFWPEFFDLKCHSKV